MKLKFFILNQNLYLSFIKDSTGNDRIVLDCLDWIEMKVVEALRNKTS